MSSSNNIPKFEHNGYIAVLTSPQYGAGWSTWSDPEEREFMMFDPDIVELILNNQHLSVFERIKEISLIVSVKGYNSYSGGLDQLVVNWVPKGTKFRIVEDDGNEKIELESNIVWDVA